MKNNLFPVAKEGWKYIGCVALSFIFFALFDFDILEFISFLALLFFIFVYRNPERLAANFQENSVVSPVDGIVISIEEIDDKEYSYKIEIESSYFNVSFLRAPLNASLKSVHKKSGARLPKFDELARKINENTELIFEDNQKNKVKIIHMAKQSFDGITIGVTEGQNVLQSSRYGLMVNGLTTLYLPQNFRLNISVGNELLASESLIGYFSKLKKKN